MVGLRVFAVAVAAAVVAAVAAEVEAATAAAARWRAESTTGWDGRLVLMAAGAVVPGIAKGAVATAGWFSSNTLGFVLASWINAIAFAMGISTPLIVIMAVLALSPVVEGAGVDMMKEGMMRLVGGVVVAANTIDLWLLFV